MFSAGIPEKIIKGITSHKSTKALKVYERPMVNQLQAVSNVMNQPSSSFSSELQEVRSRTEVYEHKKETVTSGGGLLGSMFSDCNIQISPQSMVVDILQSMVVNILQAPSTDK